MYLKMANNLPNTETTGPAAGVSDPFVRLKIGDTEVNSSVVRNSLNPEWRMEPLSLGYQLSAKEIQVDIFDYDIGTTRRGSAQHA